ncbi:MAG: BPL-N domain-containing protein [Pseudobdellovibrionaceae bacterium]
MRRSANLPLIPMNTISIYEDYTHNNGVLTLAVQDAWPHAKILHMDAAEIAEGKLEGCDLFIIPGGASLYYSEKLDGAGNAAIRKWVEAGGTFLGICAGAYYACGKIDWARETQYAITRDGELNFFEGCATGPIKDFIEDGDVDKCWDALITLQQPDGTSFQALYAAGPIFDEPKADAPLQVIARYADLEGCPPAILAGSIGKGRVVLSAVHLEYSKDLYSRALYQHRNPYKIWQDKLLANWPEDKAANLPLLRQFVEAD